VFDVPAGRAKGLKAPSNTVISGEKMEMKDKSGNTIRLVPENVDALIKHAAEQAAVVGVDVSGDIQVLKKLRGGTIDNTPWKNWTRSDFERAYKSAKTLYAFSAIKPEILDTAKSARDKKR